jgi:hypothetical protein
MSAQPASFDAYGLQVNVTNVLGIRAVIMDEVARLNTSLRRFREDHSAGMPVLGGDPVSPYAAQGFTEVTNQMLASCQADINELAQLGESLAQAARSYGLTEQQITDSLTSTQIPAPPPGLMGNLLAEQGRPPASTLAGLLLPGQR